MPVNTDRLVDLFGLAGKTAVVTGGSRGIGYMIANGLLDAGCGRVVISARKTEQVKAAAEQLSAGSESAGSESAGSELSAGSSGHDRRGKCVAVPADLSTPEGCQLLADAVADMVPSLHILVNNAGASWGAVLDDFPLHGWDKVMDINVRSPFLLTQKLLPLLRAAAHSDDPARVVNIASVAGIQPPTLETYSYSASKAGIIMLTRHLGQRLAPESITVNAIAPGPFYSKMMAFMLDDPEARAEVAASVPLGRVGEPDDVAGAAVYLTSKAGAFLTGAVLPVGGGMACVSGP